MTYQLDVVGLGTNAIDQVIELYRIPDADAKVVCPPEKYKLFDGGVMGNTLTGLSRLGLQTGYLGKLGDDHFGELIKKSCDADGIDLSHCEIVSGKQSAYTWALMVNVGMAQSAEKGSYPEIMCATEDNLKQRANSGPTGMMNFGGPVGECKL